MQVCLELAAASPGRPASLRVTLNGEEQVVSPTPAGSGSGTAISSGSSRSGGGIGSSSRGGAGPAAAGAAARAGAGYTCLEFTPPAHDPWLNLTLAVPAGAAVLVDRVSIHCHVQYLGFRDPDGVPGPHFGALRRLNAELERLLRK